MNTKICHVTSVHNSDDVRIFEKESVSLAKKAEYEVYLVAPGEPRNDKNVSVIGIGEKPSSRVKRMISFSKNAYKEALKVDADIYHLHDPELLRYALSFKKNGKKVIFDAHEDTIGDIRRKEYIPKIFRKVITVILEKYLQYVVPRIDAIVTVTPRIVENYKKYTDNVYLITNYPIIDDKEPILSSKNEDKTMLCFAGGISPQWSHEYILDAISRFEDVEYTFFGSASDDYINKLKQKDGWSKAHFMGKVPFDVVNRELWNADIGMALCQYVLDDGKTGTLGNTKLFEMMLHKLPVIATDYSIWVDIVEGKNCGVCVDPSNVDQICDAVKFIKENPEIAKKMGENGRKAVLTEYNWSSQERTLYQAYESII